MTLISSISGIRGTIGGKPGEGLTPVDLTKFASAYGSWLLKKNGKKKLKVVIGRDARISGDMVCGIVCNTLNALGVDTIELGMATTPTVEIAVVSEKADGGIIITASHNPVNWNALKLLNDEGEFLSSEEGEEVLQMAGEEKFSFVPWDELGIRIVKNDYHFNHIEKILALDLVKTDLIKKAGFRLVVDGVNSVGGFTVPELLRKLGVHDIIELNCEPTGLFAHDPEPLPKNLTGLSEAVVQHRADLGIVVDPDVDRLAFICENGEMFGEEYTLVAVADYVLSKYPGNTVSNLSSTEALSVVTEKYGGKRYLAAVGEVNVVRIMKEVNAIIGGEGNGGVIFPALHYGRDALAGIALFLSHLAEKGKKISELRKTYPDYFMAKNKVLYDERTDAEKVFSAVSDHFKEYPQNTIDGLFIKLENGWIHFRRSNTEPVFRIYIETNGREETEKLSNQVVNLVSNLISHA
ncbi:MAG TPA: phosphoglucosamine mutase [Bacteroidetes bacterium]|nr:phosphoglucosamine mutase [Bacteroidota bacterium]